MSDFLIQPIKLSDNVFRCIQPTTKTTSLLVTGDAVPLNDGYMLFECPNLSPASPLSPTDSADSDRVYAGSVEFGTSCGVTGLRFHIEARQETKNNNYDYVKIWLNGALQAVYSSTEIRYPNLSSDFPPPAGAGSFAEGTDYSRPYERLDFEYDIDIPCIPNPCGNRWFIEASTGDISANHGTFVYVEWTTLP